MSDIDSGRLLSSVAASWSGAQLPPRQRAEHMVKPCGYW